jgi:hypothetical protein
MSSEIKVDTISENTSANGVAIDSVTLKDGAVTATAASTITTADNLDQLTLVSTDADANTGPILKLLRDSGSPADNDLCAVIKLNGDNDANEDTQCYEIRAAWNDVSNGTEDGAVRHALMVGGTLRDVMTLDSGITVFNEEGQDIDFRVEAGGGANSLFLEGGSAKNGMFITPANLDAFAELSNHTGGHFINGAGSGNAGITIFTGSGNNGHFAFADGTSGTEEYKGLIQYRHGSDDMQLYTNHTAHFKIGSDGTLTATDTSIGAISSDQRLKENIQDYSYDISKFKTMKPRSFDWKFPDAHPYEAKVGFVAQELETVDSELVITEDFIENTIKPANFDDEKALLTDGKKKTTKLGKKDAMYISVIQQLITRIEALEAN